MTTYKPLIAADNVIYLITCDVNGLEFLMSQEPILLGEQYGYNDYLKFLSINGRFAHDEEAMQGALGEIEGIIPYCESIPELWNQGKALNPVPCTAYNGVMASIAEYLTRKEK
jgi:hypothetical protein